MICCEKDTIPKLDPSCKCHLLVDGVWVPASLTDHGWVAGVGAASGVQGIMYLPQAIRRVEYLIPAHPCSNPSSSPQGAIK